MSAQIVIWPEAQSDLDDQAEYYLDNASLEIALQFLAAADETFALIVAQPMMGSERRLSDPALRSSRWVLLKRFEEHIVFYRPNEDRVEILRVLHGKRDLQVLLGDVSGQ